MSPALRHPLRVLSRLARFLVFNTRGWARHARQLRRHGTGGDPRSRATWLNHHAVGSLAIVGVRTVVHGRPPTQGMVVCNHLSYLDIPVLASTGLRAFVSKAEVKSWPLLGALATCGGTLFLKREVRSHVAEIAGAFAPIIETGTVVVIFPEGTSSGGDSILPFRTSLLEPAAAHRWPVTPAYITYELDPAEGTLADDVAYWREMTFAPHFLNLLAKRSLVAHVHFGEPISGLPDRKELTRQLHAAVCRLKDRHGR